jgi:xanthine dehydrogenase YagT iron-sulfur-binding subunit
MRVSTTNQERNPMKTRYRNGSGERGVTRRSFLSSVSAAPVATAAMGQAPKPVTTPPAAGPREPVRLTLRVNGRSSKLLVEPRDTLLTALREKLGLSGTKPGCERGECGACTVLIDGLPRYACLTLALEAEGQEITTIEGLMKGEELGPVQQAFLERDGMQCGYCTPGQVMAAEGLLRVNANPTSDEIRRAMSGNLCRCGAYDHIFKAVRRAAEARRAGGAK